MNSIRFIAVGFSLGFIVVSCAFLSIAIPETWIFVVPLGFVGGFIGGIVGAIIQDRADKRAS